MFGRLGPALDAGFFIVLQPFEEKGERTSHREWGGPDDPDTKIFDN
jgi:hypothetical protein